MAADTTTPTAATTLKTQGNDHLKAGRLEQATECYTKALESCDPTEAAAL